METIESFFLLILRASWHASILAAVILGLQWVFRRQLTPNWRYVLWFAFLIRLAIPITPSSDLSAHNLAPVHLKSIHAIPEPIQSYPALLATPPLKESLPPIDRSTEINLQSTTITPTALPPQQSEEDLSPFQPPTGVQLISLIWIVTATALTLRLITRAFLFDRKLTEGSPPIPSQLKEIFQTTKRTLGLENSPIAITLSNHVKSPCLFGIFRARLILPPSIVHDLSKIELECVLLHELVHFKRYDIWCSWVMSLLQSFHWFNPVVWFAMHRIRADREMATDAGVLRQANEQQQACYGELIVKLLDRLRRPSGRVPGAITMVESKHQLRDRIRAIARFSKRHRVSSIGLMVTLGTLLSFLLDASPTESGPASKDSPLTTQIVVTVVDETNKQPIEGSRVKADALTRTSKSQEWVTKDEHSLSQFTDVSGKAVIAELSIGAEKYRFTASHEDYSTTSIQIDTEENPLPNEANIFLKDGNYVSGIVTDSTGRPIENVVVTVLFMGGYERGGSDLTTDRNGRWQCTILPEGINLVSVGFQHPDYALEPIKAGQSYQFEYTVILDGHTGWPLPPDSRQKKLKLADLPNREDRTMLVPGSPLRGHVVNQSGLAITNAVVTINNSPQGEYLRTDSEGAFVSENSYIGEITGSLRAKDYAPQTFSIEIKADTPDQRFTLSYGHSIRFRFISAKGDPIEGVRIHPERTKGFRIGGGIPFVSSDENGFLEWKNAPNEPVTFAFLSRDCYPTRERTLSPGKRVHEIRLSKTLNVTLNAIDTDGNPIPSFRVVRGTRSGNYTNWDPDTSVSGRDGLAKFPDPMSPYYRSDQEWPSYVFRVEADGFMGVRTRTVSISEEEVALSVTLKRSEVIRRTLVDASGKPLGNRNLWLLDPGKSYSCSIASLSLDRDEAEEIRTDEQGQFVTPRRPRAHTILGLFEDGFIHESLNEINTHTLTPWGSLSGNWLEDGQMKKGVKIGFTPDPQNAIPSASASIHFIDSTTTNDQGQFQFDRVPAMNLRVCRIIELDRLTNYQWLDTFEVGSDIETHITLNHPKLRSLRGRAEIPEAVKFKTAPSSITATLEPPLHALLESKFKTLDTDDYERWYLNWIQTEEGKAHAAARLKIPHGVSIGAGGNLTAESIFPGKYLLTLTYEGREVDHQRKNPRLVLAKATRHIEITADSPDVIDLGQITLEEVRSQAE